jgi:glucosylceramidase
MNMARKSISGIGLAVLLAACGSGNNTTQSQGGSSGSGGDSSGGSGGGDGGSGGSSDGSGGKASGGSGGKADGGASGSGSGGAAGSSGGSSGSQGGGSSGSSGSGSGGKAAGGAGGGASGSGSGGAQPAGGSQAGGTQGSGGAGSGGAQAPSTVLVTSASGAYWKTGTWTEGTGNATVTVNDTTTNQKWEGFGGAFNELGWKYLSSKDMQDQAMQLLFSDTDGANFSMGRIPMGASDYATVRYTCDEGGTDTSMAKFNTTQDEKYLIPYVKAALAVKSDIKLWASPWTPPTWMKTGPFTATTSDNKTTSSNFDSGNMKDDAANLTAYAQYFVKFIAAYKAVGANISIVAPQNEPNYALHYPSCIWTSALFTKFVGQYLGPALKDTGVGIMVGTMSNADSGKDIDIGNAVMGDSTAASFIKVAGVQWNVLDKVNGGTKFGSLPIWATEHKCGNYPWDGASGCGDGSSTSCPAYNKTQAPNDQAYGVESWYQIRNAIVKGKVTAYNAWNMVLDKTGLGNDDSRDWKQNALLVADGGKVNPTPAYYVFRHLSQYAIPGGNVVGTSGGDAIAFKNPDGSLVAVMYNSGAANSNYSVKIGGKTLQFSMPGQGWATVKYKP